MSGLDPAVKEALLRDPAVQAKLQAAGQDALNDPEVQRQIMATCQEKFPQYASQAGAAVNSWAQDPATQQKAKEYAGAAMGYAAGAGGALLAEIEQGPEGVRLLAFFASAASSVLALMAMNPLNIFGHPILYVVSIYQIAFAFSTILFEMKPDWVTQIQAKTGAPVDKAQAILIENAKFLSLNGGRGTFYIFQATLWLGFAGLTELLKLAVGIALLFIGILHLLMAKGIMPQQIVQKMRSRGGAGYQQVDGQPPSNVAGP